MSMKVRPAMMSRAIANRQRIDGIGNAPVPPPPAIRPGQSRAEALAEWRRRAADPVIPVEQHVRSDHESEADIRARKRRLIRERGGVVRPRPDATKADQQRADPMVPA